MNDFDDSSDYRYQGLRQAFAIGALPTRLIYGDEAEDITIVCGLCRARHYSGGDISAALARLISPTALVFTNGKAPAACCDDCRAIIWKHARKFHLKASGKRNFNADDLSEADLIAGLAGYLTEPKAHRRLHDFAGHTCHVQAVSQ